MTRYTSGNIIASSNAYACLRITAVALLLNYGGAFAPSSLLLHQQSRVQSQHHNSRRFVSSVPEEVTKEENDQMIVDAIMDLSTIEPPIVPANLTDAQQTGSNAAQGAVADEGSLANRLWQSVVQKMGQIDESRYIFPDYVSGEVPRLFSALEYNNISTATESARDDSPFSAIHATGSVIGAAALVAGTTVGAGVLALPSATITAGFLPSTAAMISAWVYMTMSGLLIAELTLNRMAVTGRPGLGLLELYESSLGKPWSYVGSAAYFFLHYAMMVAYIAQGGNNLSGVLDGVNGQVAFAAVCGLSLYFINPRNIEKMNNLMVAGVAATFAGIVAIGAQTANFNTLIDPVYQHPEQVIGCFPILFLALVFQNVVPTIVNQLEGDRSKIIKAIVGGTTAPLLMFMAWNAVVLGNVLGSGTDSVADPVAVLQSGSGMIGPLVSAFSSLALVTSIIGFTYGLIDAWTDIFKIPSKGQEYEKYKLGLFALVFLPPLGLSLADPDIFYRALEYGGAFGVSTLFLVLPPVMVWKERYGQDQKPLVTKPMVPFGKIPLGSMWKAAGTLILEQGAEKLGVFEFISEHILHNAPAVIS